MSVVARKIKEPYKRAVVKPKVNTIYAKYLMPSMARWIFMFGGGGSGKSVAASQKCTMRLSSEHTTQHKLLCVRKTYSSIEESMYDRLIREIDSHGLSSAYDVKKSPLSITRKPSKRKRNKKRHQSRVVFRGMDNEEKIKSIEAVTIIWIEEGTELSESEFLQLDARLRGKTNSYYQIIVTFNPVNKNHWIAKYAEPQMFDAQDRHDNISNVKVLVPGKVWEYDRYAEVDGRTLKTVVRSINTTHKDNEYLPDEYRATLESMGSALGSMHVVYAKGRWYHGNQAGLFFPTFDYSKHTKIASSVAYNPDLPIHLSIDFNIQPYMSGLLFQIHHKTGYWNGYTNYIEVTVFDEIAATAPHNTAHGLGQLFAARYPESGGFYLYGDATGTRGLGVKDTKSLFEDFERGLGVMAGFANRRIPKSNPKYKAIAKGSLGRQGFCTRLFSGDTVPIRMIVSRRCTNFIKDLQEVQVTPEGKIKKIKDKDGIELLGHMSDCFAYFVCHPDALGEYAYNFIKPTA